MSAERYRVISITGYPITDRNTYNPSDAKLGRAWHVLDTGNNYRLLGTWRTERAAMSYVERLLSGKRPRYRSGWTFEPTCPYCFTVNGSKARKCVECGGRLV